MSNLVDVIMPVYNAALYLKSSIESILSQSSQDFKFIIIDDWSTDWSRDILEEYAKKDPRIKLLYNENNSWICFSLNKAIQESSAKYILRMDADDISHNNRIQLQVDFMENHPDVWVCWCDVQCIDKGWEILFVKKYPYIDKNIRKSLFLFNPINHPGSIMRRDVFNKTWWYDSDLILAEDLDLRFRMWKHSRLANMSNILLDYRVYNTNSTYSKSRKMIQQSIRTRISAIKKHWYNAGVLWLLAIAFIFLIQRLPHNILHCLFYRLRKLVW